MNKIYTIIILVVGIILSIFFLPVINDAINSTILLEHTDTIPPIFEEPTPYVVVTEYEPVSIISIDNDYAYLPESTYSLDNGVLTILSTNAPVHTFDLDIKYLYEDPDTSSFNAVIRLIPFLIVTGVVLIVVIKIKGGK